MRSRSLFALLVIASIFGSQTALSAQTRKGTVAANKSSAAGKCTGAWTGLVTYTRTQSMTDNKKVERVSGRGYDTRKWEMKYDYRARVSVVDGVEGNGSSDAKATVRHFMSSDETIDAVELNSCDRGKTWKEMKGTSKSLTKSSGSETTEASFSVGMNDDGSYTVSVAIPQIKGKTEGSQSTTFSGQCTKKEGKSFTMPPTETSIDGTSLTSSGAHKVDPKNPNKIAGSFTQTFQNVTETIDWNLQRCGGELRLVDIKFEDMKFPDWNAWREISEQESTVDGNLVKITATVLNTSPQEKYADIRFKETYKGDKWDGARPDAPLDDNVVSVKAPPREET
ncbi:MAG: hypothetical protein ABIR33_16825 [Pyrinomonadaceae bacterium]